MKRGLVLGSAAFAVLLVVVLATRERNVSEGVRRLALPPLAKDSVTEIVLSGVKSATLVKEGGTWKVLDPARPETRYVADPLVVNPLVDAISALGRSGAADFVTERTEKHVEYEVDLGKGQRVRVATAGGPGFELIVGKAGGRGGVYLRRPDDNAVFWAQSSLSWQARKDVTDLRRKQLFEVAEKELRALSLKPFQGTAYRLERAEEGKPWALAEGAPAVAGFRLDPEAANRIARAFADLRAQRFLAAGTVPEAKLGLGAATVVARTAGGQALTLELGTLPDKDDGRLAQALHDQFAQVDADGSGKVDAAELQKAAEAKPEAKEAPAREAAQRLVKEPARFARFDTGAWEGRVADQALTRDDLEAVTRTAAFVPARRTGSDEVALVAGWSVEQLLLDVAALRDLALFSFDATKVGGLELSENGKTTLAVTKTGAEWQVRTPATWTGKAPFDPKRVGFKLSEIRRWRALRVAEGISPAQAGLGSPTATVGVKAEDGTKQTLALGKPVPGKKPAEHYARGAIDGLVYVVGDAVRTAIRSGPALVEKVAPPPSFGGGGQGLENLPPEVRKQIEAIQAGGGG